MPLVTGRDNYDPGPFAFSSRKLNLLVHMGLIDHIITGQVTSTRTLFFRRYVSFIEELVPSLLGTGATLGACEC